VFSFGNLPSIEQQIFDLGLNKLFAKYYRRKIAPALSVSSNEPIEQVGYVCGANLFVEKRLFDEIGGFDEEFFMYWEEVDLCRRFSVLGTRCTVIPEAKILHHESVSTLDESREFNYQKYEMLERSKYLYFKKHHGEWSIPFVKIIQIISLVIHTPFSNQQFWKSAKICHHV